MLLETRKPRFSSGQGAKSRVLLLLALTLFFGCGEAEVGSETDALAGQVVALDDVAQELQTSFNDAALYCEAYLLTPLREARDASAAPLFRAPPKICGDNPGVTGCVGDALMVAFAQLTDRRLSPSAPHGVLPTRSVSAAQKGNEMTTNGCADAVQSFDSQPLDPTVSPAPGLCRADFNYCIAQQLRLKAESLWGAPSSRAAQRAVLHEARIRFASAADEHAKAFGYIDDHRDAVCPETMQVPSSSGNTNDADWTVNDHLDAPVCNVDDCTCQPPVNCTNICNLWRNGCLNNANAKARAVCANHKIPNTTVAVNAVATTYGIPDAFKSGIAASFVDGGGSAEGPFSAGVRCPYKEHHPKITWTTVCKTGDTFQRDKLRVQQGYGDKALERIGDALAQVEATAEDEVRSLLGDADAVPVRSVARPGSYGSAVWGDGAPRAAAAGVLMGTHATTGSEHPFAQAPVGDDTVRVALRLILEFGARLPYSATLGRDASGKPVITAVEWPRPDAATLTSFAPTTLADLTRLAAERVNGPLSAGADLLAQDYGITQTAVEGALRLLDDQLRTTELDFTFVVPNLAIDPAAATVAPAIALKQVVAFQRSALPFSAALSRLSPRKLPSFLNVDYLQYDVGGASAAVAIVRSSLLALSGRTGLRNWASSDALQRDIAAVDTMVGNEWTAVRFAQGGSLVERKLPLGSALRQYSYTRDAEVSYCLRYGHRPGKGPESCRAALTSLTAQRVQTGGRLVDQLTLPAAPSSGGTTPVYLFARTCTDDCDPSLLDVIYPAEVQTHAYGGRMWSLLSDVLAKKPSDPAYAQTNSLGIDDQFVPSFRQLSDSGNVDDLDFHVRRLAQAAQQVEIAKTQLSSALSMEEDYVVRGNQVVTAIEHAKQGAIEEISSACAGNAAGNGTTPPCTVPRRATITLAELHIVDRPTSVPMLIGRPAESCVDYTPTLEMPPESTKSSLQRTLGNALACTRWRVAQSAADTVLHNVPEPVISALQSTVTDDPNAPSPFASYGGELQTILQTYYQALVDLRHGLETFQSSGDVADQAFKLTLNEIDSEQLSDFDVWKCRIGMGLKVLNDAAKVYIASQTGGVLPTEGSAPTKDSPGTPADVGSAETGSLAFDTINTALAITKCDDTTAADKTAHAAYFQVAQAIEQMKPAGYAAERMVSVTALMSNSLDSLARKVQSAFERVALEQRLGDNDPLLSNPIWRRLRGQTATRARNRLQLAQQRLFEARRAVEYRTATDLRQVAIARQNEQPATQWSGRLFALDPADLSGDLDDYHTLLEQFVADYRDAHHYQENLEDDAVLSLAGIITNEVNDRVRMSVPLIDRIWFTCHDRTDALLGGRRVDENGVIEPGAPCEHLGGVVSVSVSFDVPRGLGRYLRSQLQGPRANRVHHDLVLNVRGTELRNCDLAEDQEACLDASTLPYTLAQDSQVLLDNLDGQLQAFDLSPMVMRNVPALAAGVRLSDTVARNMIAQKPALRRTEFSARPVAGRYTLTIPSSPEIQWQGVQDVEILLRHVAWTPEP